MCLKLKMRIQKTCILPAVKLARCSQSLGASAAQTPQSLRWRHQSSVCVAGCGFGMCMYRRLGTEASNTFGGRPERIQKALCTETRLFYFSAVQRNRGYFALNECTETKK